jgi:uncharacterized protein (TIGR00269 family)
MLCFEDTIAIAVSGGKDSVTLLHILAKIERAFPKAKLTAITVDEGISGYRDEALRIAKETCHRLGVAHVIASFEELFGYRLDEVVSKIRQKAGKGLTPCAYCGVLRRRVLNSTARSLGATKLATAHNLDDETQTALLNILHGNPLRIARVKPVLSSTHPRLVPRVKPLSEILEKETTLYTYLKKIDFQSIPCPYSRQALRNDIRTMLNRMEEKHPGMKYTVYRSAERLSAFLEKVRKAEKLGNCKLCGEPTMNEICQSCEMLQDLGN